jgi:hypothetical protein
MRRNGPAAEAVTLAADDDALGFRKAVAACSPRPVIKGAGFTRPPMPRTPCPRPHCPALRRPCKRSATPRTDHALKAVTAFETTHGAKFPRAARKITADVDELPCGRPVAGR